MKSLAALKNVFGSEDNKENNRENANTGYYPFWNMKSGQRAVVRFLPDANDSNERGFLVEKVFHNLTINGQRKMVPCLSMYGDDCPICKLSQEYYKAKDDVNGKKYWKKKQYMAQVLVVEDPLEADATTGENHEGKVRLISLGFQIYNIIKEAFKSDELEVAPFSYEGGYDFIIKKSEQGQYASYAVGTKFMNKQRDLSDEEIGVVEEGLIDLSTVLPKHPGVEKVEAMLQADLNGEDYSEGDSDDGGFTQKSAKPTPRPAPKPAADEDDDTPPSKPISKPTPAASDTDVDDMIAAIQKRRANKQ
jgi:hypothetical protein